MTPDPLAAAARLATGLGTDAASPAASAPRTPALVVVRSALEHNLDRLVAMAGGPDRLRPHMKSARFDAATALVLGAGVCRVKAATVEEVCALVEAGAPDVLYAFPAWGPDQRALAEVARRHPGPRVSVLVDSPDAVATWRGPVEAFIDLDVGMGRTGLPADDVEAVLALASALRSDGHRLRGLHAYDGHLVDATRARRRAAVRGQLRCVVGLVAALERAGHEVDEVVLGGTHTGVDLAELGANALDGRVRLGPGTALLNDTRSLARLAGDGLDLAPAAFVVSRVVSASGRRRTLDAGLTAAQVDGGTPHVEVVDRPAARVVSASQEHLVVEVEPQDGPETLPPGSAVALLPRHVDTAIAQFPGVWLLEDDERLTWSRAAGRWSAPEHVRARPGHGQGVSPDWSARW